MTELAEPVGQIIWLNAADPAQILGEFLKTQEDREFVKLPGTAGKDTENFRR